MADEWTTMEALVVDGAPADTDRLLIQKVGEEGLDWKTTTRGTLRAGLAPATCSFVVFAADGALTGEKVLGTDVIMYGTLAARPAASVAGRLYYVTDSGSAGWCRDSGSAWVSVPSDWAVIVNKPATFAPSAHGSSAHTGNILPGGANQDLGAAYLDISQEAAPANPGAGVRRIFVDSGTGKLSVRTSAGSTVSLEESGAGGGAPLDATYIVTAANGTLTSELVLGTSIVMAGTLASRPAAGTAGRLYYVTDSGVQRWTRDNGSSWDDTAINWAQIIGAPALAPTSASYVTMAAEAGLSAETVLGTGVVMKGTLAARPAAATAGRLYYVTDASSARWTRDTGSAWEDCPPDWSQVLNKPSAFAPSAHHATHEPGGSDPMTVDAAAGTGSLRTLGTGAAQACAGNDSRLSDARTPTAHAASHKNGGTDEVAVAAAAANAIPKAGGAGTLAKEWLPAATTAAQGAVQLAVDRDTTSGMVITTDDVRAARPWQRLKLYDHFSYGYVAINGGAFGDTGGWVGNGLSQIISESGHPGIARVSSPNTSTEGNLWYGDAGFPLALGSDVERFGFRVRLSSTSNARMMVGVAENPADDLGGTDSVYLYVDSTLGNSNWRSSVMGATTVRGGGDLGVAAGTGWVDLEARRVSGDWKFYINGSLVGSITTPYPTTTGVLPFVRVLVTSGATAKNIDLDTFWLESVAL